MRRRAPGEQVEPYRQRLHRPEGHKLRAKIVKWAQEQPREVAWPDLPREITDRAADVWEPLIGCADMVGGSWPERARKAAVALQDELAEAGRESFGLRLLGDVRLVFNGHAALSSAQLLEALKNIEESPWGDMPRSGRPLDARGLSRILAPYGVRSKVIRIGDSTPRGYVGADFEDAWLRYLDPPDPDAPVLVAPAEETQGSFDEMATDDEEPPFEPPPDEDDGGPVVF